MVTLNQLLKNPRIPKIKKSMTKGLCGAPFRFGTCAKVTTMSPKKPNSAIRKIAKVKLSSGYRITAAIPGIGHSLQEHSNVIVRAGRANDLPGVRYKLVRGKLDFVLESYGRKKKRSKYGVKKH